ncbi:FGGY family carbohydrate kinase [uncultured Sphaerochaeta sp.]|uniref:xylulokinase n=1 Tax=uncultured Sphaerochaeta sp. TaxID=886478 RepID=UPI002A0A5E5C|nr:FGGY family carbohydrate kinase [uncultured Sphaerochaeta sp.]
MTERILVYDIGTTSVKTMLFDLAGNETEQVSVSYPTTYRQRCVEQDPEDFWQAAIEGTKDLSEQGRTQVIGIGISGHMNGALCLDRQGRSVRPELIHSDTRSLEESTLIQKIQPEGFLLHGNRVNEHLSLSKIHWIFRHERENYEKTAFFVNSKDYLRSKLTGQIGESDFSDASLSGALDMQKKDWDGDLLASLGLDPCRFPRLRKSTEIGGHLISSAALVLGLKQGIPVSMGAGDAACATRGAGMKDASQAYACLGSSAWISTLNTQVVPDKDMRLQHFFDLDGEHVNVCGTVQCTGIAFDWIMKTLGLERSEVENHLRQCRPGSKGILFAPYLLGDRSPFWDSKARGAFVGLSLSQGPLDIAQSVHEGVAFALASVLEVYTQLGFGYDCLTVLGGVARNRPFLQLLSNVLGKPLDIHPQPTQGSGRGAAMAAMVAIGASSTLEEAMIHWEVTKDRVLPDESKTRQYERLYPIFEKLYESGKPINDALYRIWNEEDAL